MAVLVSHRELERLQGRRVHFADAYRTFLKTHPLREIGVDDDFAASTRDRTTNEKDFARFKDLKVENWSRSKRRAP